MSPSPDEATSKPDVATPDEPAAPTEAAAAAPATEASGAELSTESSAAEAPSTDAEGNVPAVPAANPAPAVPKGDDSKLDEREPLPRNVLLYTVFSLLCIGIALWLVLAWSGYKEKYSQQTEGWRLGSTRMLEITLIREDKKNLACASDKVFEGVHCGFHHDGTPWGTKPDEDPNVLQPFNTVKNELFLAAGLWQAPILQGELPKDRFTVVCNYKVTGVLKAVSLRWSPTGNFNPVDQSVAVGSLSDCVIPQ
jgi:hypothetical protein